MSYEKCFIGFPRGFINKCDHLHFFVENVLEALKKHSKQKPTRKSQFLNPYGVMVYNIVDGPSKLLCNQLPYLKTKKDDLITTYAKRWTTTVRYLKLICDRRCATISFVYFLNVWVINLDRKGFCKMESTLTHPLRTAWIQDLSPISSPKRFLSNYYSLSLKEKIY